MFTRVMASSAVSPGVRSRDAATATFESRSPASGEMLATYPIDGEREVAAAVRRARDAAAWWGGLSFEDRKLRLLAWKSSLTRYMARLAQIVHEETGKPVEDALAACFLSAPILGRTNCSKTK